MNDESFGLDVSRDDGTAVLSGRGELDLRYRDLVVSTAIRLLGEVPVVIIDLSETTFLDSAGLGALIQARKEAEHLGRHLRVRSATGIVARTLEVSGLAEWLTG